MARLVLLVPGQVIAARLAGALREEYELDWMSGWAGVDSALSDPRVEGAILDPFDALGRLRSRELLRIRLRHPDPALTVLTDSGVDEADLLEIGGIGIDGIIPDPGPGGQREIREQLQVAMEHAVAGRVRRLAADRLPELAVQCLAAAVQLARGAAQSSDLAEALLLSDGALRSHLRELRLPPPRRLLLWGRLIVAGHILESTAATVEEAAFRVQYSTAPALRAALRSAVGTTPLTLAERGGWRYVAEAAIEDLGGRPRATADHPTVM